MELTDLLNEIMPYLLGIMGTVITFIAGKLGLVAKDFFDDITKRNLAEQTVKFVRQVGSTLELDEKFALAQKTMLEELSRKGIQVSDLELQVLIESAYNGFKSTWDAEDALKVPNVDPSEEVSE